MRAFVTGGSGFVGTWLTRHLETSGDRVSSLPIEIDICDTDAVHARLVDADPEVIYHLAALTHVGESWQAPTDTFKVNALGTLSLLEAARSLSKMPRVVLISSAEVYGTGRGEPIDEDAPLAPVTPYASSKVAAEFIGLQQFLGRGLEVIRARPFNHIGPGQSESFVVSALARRVVQAEREDRDEIRVGNLDAARDFTDVRDVVRAYRLLAELGVPGEVYNVCSGEVITIASVLRALIERSTHAITAVADPELLRPVDVPVVRGNGAKLREITGWHPAISRETTFDDVMVDWRSRLATLLAN